MRSCQGGQEVTEEESPIREQGGSEAVEVPASVPLDAMELQIILNKYADQVFRDQADRDYVASRLSHRASLREQFLWSALQAMEKYYKSILLYNGKPSLGYGHNLKKLFSAVGAISHAFSRYPSWSSDFINYLNTFGMNRYLTSDAWTMGDELQKLDEVVWCTRRYCQYFHFDDGQGHDLYQELIDEIDSDERRSDPRRYLPHSSGVLEEILQGNPQGFARRALVWKNFFYGKGRNRSFTYIRTSTMEVPPHRRDWAQDPRIQSEIKRYVKIN
jgi:HEPN domain